MSNANERALFEAWYVDCISGCNGEWVEKDYIGNYLEKPTRDAWDSWQTRAALAQPACDVEPAVWRVMDDDGRPYSDWVSGTPTPYGIEHHERAGRTIQVAYTHPQQDVQAAATANQEALIRAAKAVIDRWDSPKWKDLPHTAEHIHRLRKAITEAEQVNHG